MSDCGTPLIVDDDPSILALIEYEMEQVGIAVRTAATGEDALTQLTEWRPSALVLDLQLPDLHGQEILRRVHASHPNLPIVVVTGNDDIDVAVECMRAGASDFLQKPLVRARLVTSVRNAHERGQLRARLAEAKGELGVPSILGTSPSIRSAIELLKRALNSDLAVLIEGESGTGKELFARALHEESRRSLGPFVPVNCGSFAESLIDSELFGHETGAFTGAGKKRKGLVQRADGGTLFLDEIGELSRGLQVRLLRVLQEGQVRPVGSNDVHRVDVRVVAATNRMLEEEVRSGRFREDLYYRVASFPIKVPPLRKRGEDVLLLAEHFLVRAAEHCERGLFGFSVEAKQAILTYSWPGNVRQLESAVRRAVLLEDGPTITLDALPDEVVCALLDNDEHQADQGGDVYVDEQLGGEDIRTMAAEEQRILLRALTITNWNVEEAARRLGIGRATVYRRIQSYSLKRDASRGGSANGAAIRGSASK